jgi:hypothetical protein
LHPLSEAFPLAVTIGNVYYRQNNIYKVTRTSIAQTVAEGFRADKNVDVHVWLTLDDMTVFDLTIVPTLISNGLLAADTPPLLMWRETDQSDFKFEPLLADNKFFERVDTGIVRLHRI